MNNFEDVGHFSEGKERKDLVRKNAEKIEKFKKNAEKKFQMGHYNWIDSPLDERDEFNSMTFRESFEKLLPKDEKSLKHYIEQTLKDKKGKAVGVEFGGIGVKFFNGFSKGFFKKTVGVSLVDHRDIFGIQGTYVKTEKGFKNLYEINKTPNHEVLEGDIFSPECYKSLEEKLKGDKINLIIERMASGLEFVPEDPYMVSRVLQIWYKLLDEEGLMLVQVPIIFDELLKKWAYLFAKEYKSVFEFNYDATDSKILGASVFSLHKLKGAPEELPFLDPRTVKKTRKNSLLPFK